MTPDHIFFYTCIVDTTALISFRDREGVWLGGNKTHIFVAAPHFVKLVHRVNYLTTSETELAVPCGSRDPQVGRHRHEECCEYSGAPLQTLSTVIRV